MNRPCKTLLSVLALGTAHPLSAADVPVAAAHPLDLTSITATGPSRERIATAKVQTQIDATLQADGSVLLHCQHEHRDATPDPRRPEQEK